MRLFPIVTAILVVGVLFLLVFQRDELVTFSGAETEPVQGEVFDAVVDRDENAPLSPVSVVAIRSSASTIDGAVVLRGRTEASRQVIMRAETSGQVISDPLRAGARVQKGDLLCRLDPGTRAIALAEAQAGLREAVTRLPESQARVAEARARLNEAEINDNAAERLSQGGFASDTRVAQATASVEAARAGVQSAVSGVESARSGIQSAEARVAAAENNLEQLEVRAPFGGLLETDSAEIGTLMQPGALCATIIQLDPIKLVGFVPETMVDRVNLGALAGARLASGREVVGHVTFLSRSADPTTRTFRVDVEVPNADFSISDGQTAEIGVQSAGNTAHLLPQSALTLNDAGDLGVRLVVDNIATFAPVIALRDTTEGFWVGGLAPSVDVIVVGQEFVTDGVPVTVTYREETTQ